MSMEAQKVVVIQDASRDVSWSAIRWVLHGLSLKPGDELTLLGVLHQVINPSTLSFTGAGKLLGYKSKVDSSFFGTNKKFVEEEVARKMEEYHKNAEMVQLSNQCEMGKIKFHVEVQAGPSQKVVALKAAKKYRATWVILDRQMKKDKKYFLENLSCGISRMKRDNTIEQLRGPKEIDKAIENTKLPAGKSITSHVTYDEMIPGRLDEEDSPKKSPSTQKTILGKDQGGDGSGGPPCENHQKLPLSKSSSSDHMFTSTVSISSQGNAEASSSSFAEAKSSLHFQDEESTTKTEQETAGERLPFSIPDDQERSQTEANNTGSPNELEQHIRDGDWMGGFKTDKVFKNSVCSVCKNRRPKVGWNKEFTYAELHAATEGFSPKKFLSEGGFGSVYKGELENGLMIAVKRHNSVSFQGEKEFKSEVHVLSKARHKNLVMLLGSCSEGSHRLLVYEYVCNGSLDQHLSKHTRRPLNWDKRIKIAVGAAKGLEYLHKNNIIHRDVRPNNILVTHDHESLLGDFGLARIHYEGSDDSESKVVGTLGYLAPEYAESGRVSSKTDVYSFGVVLLQLITGLRTTDKMNGGKSLIGWARPLLKEKNYPDLIDERIMDSHDMHQLFWMVRVAEKCLSKDPRKRCSIPSVVNALNYIMEGNTTCIRDFSPVQSDSVGSIVDSPAGSLQGYGGRDGGAGTDEDEEDEESRRLISREEVSSTIFDTTSWSTTTTDQTSWSTTTTTTTTTSPPLPVRETRSGRTTTSSSKSNSSHTREKRKGTYLNYDEMIN